MRARLARLLDKIRTGFWFMPLAMLVAAFALALVLLHVDERIDPGIRGSIGWAYTGGPEGARSLLSTIAGSMITAASVTFSLATVALSIASQQYGSRVLRNFMRDRITQVLLGTFIATFIYSVLVVRTIRGSEFGGGFVPAISVTVAIALALASLVLLIYFVHHISASIQASHILRVIAKDTREAIPRLYPEKTEHSTVSALRRERLNQSGGKMVGSDRSGYIQTIDLEGLLAIAAGHDIVIELLVKPGDHMVRDGQIARLWGTAELPPDDVKKVTECFLLGGERTPIQDIRFQFQQLTEVIIRALSPGINDPFTAMNGIDELASSISLFGRRVRAAQELSDEHGALRLILPTANVAEILNETIGHIVVYAASDPFVMNGLRRVLDVASRDLQGEDEENAVRKVRDEVERRSRKAA